MTSPAENNAIDSALNVDARAAAFLVKRTARTQWDADDEAAFQAWLAQSLAHRTAYWRLESVWERAERLTALKFMVQQQARKPASQRRFFLYAMAAVFVAVVALGASARFIFLQSGPKTYSTPIGGRELIKLSDGSRIELNTDTLLRTNFSAGRRDVELLRGEALFQIRHDPAHPFTVVANGHRIVDLGTEFVVHKQDTDLKVALLEGSARLSAGTSRSALLTPGDEALATARSISISHKSRAELEDELGWQHGILIFRHATLTDVAKEFNRYNRQKIVIADAVAGSRVINATLPATNVGAFARMAQDFLGLSVEYRDDEIVISR